MDELDIDFDLEGEKLASGFSRNTNPNNAFSDIEGAWNEAIEKHPELEEQKNIIDKHTDDVNKAIQDKFEKSDSLWRGTSTQELDRIIDKGVVEPFNQNFISFTLDEEAGLGFGKNQSGVTIEYDKKFIQKSDTGKVNPVTYTPYDNYAGIGEDKDRPYPISFADEMEVRSNSFKADPNAIKTISLSKSRFLREELDSLTEKYKKAFPNSNIKETN